MSTRPATMDATAGVRERRGVKSRGTRRIVARASIRWRRTNRSARLASSSGSSRQAPASEGGVADSGKPTASSSALETRSPSPPSASTASAVSPMDGRARAQTTASTATTRIAIAAATTGAPSRGNHRASAHSPVSAIATVASASQARRTVRLSHRRRRCGARAARSWIRAGSRSPPRTARGSGGMTGGGSCEAVGRHSPGRAIMQPPRGADGGAGGYAIDGSVTPAGPTGQEDRREDQPRCHASWPEPVT